MHPGHLVPENREQRLPGSCENSTGVKGRQPDHQKE